MIFRSSQFPKAARNRRGGKIKHVSMACSLNSRCAKKFCKWTVLVQLIIEDVVTFLLGHCVVYTQAEWQKIYLG